MLPFSEFDNYKLQVALLQEKLHRSEEYRKKLEYKLEHVIQRKAEQEKLVREKQREKYESFLAELEKRNERNRQLMKILERVDQQTAALSARSERLRKMKMQHEIYFAKLLQTQTMRCIQAPTASAPTAYLTTAPIPVLLPTTPPMHQEHQQSTAIAQPPIKNNEQQPCTSPGTMSTVRAPAPTATAIYQCDASGNLIAAGMATSPTVAHITATTTLTPKPTTLPSQIGNAAGCNTINNMQTTPLATSTEHWTLALATPSGMLLTSNPAVPANLVAPTFDYAMQQQPLGYLPRMRHILQPKPNMSIYSDASDDLLPTLRANTKSDRFHRQRRTKTDNENGMKTYDDYDGERDGIGDCVEDFDHDKATRNTKCFDGGDGELRKLVALNRIDLPTRQLDNDENSQIRTTTAAMAIKDNEQRQKTEAEAELLLSKMSPTSTASLLTLDKLPKTVTMTEHENSAFASTSIDDGNNAVVGSGKGANAKQTTRFDEFSKGISMIGGIDKVALPIQRNEEEKLASAAYNATSAVISNDNGGLIEANLRQKIDSTKPWHQQQIQPQHMTQSWHQAANSTETTSGGKDNAATSRYDEMTARFSEHVENNADDGDGIGAGDGDNDVSKNAPTKLSIEKIENEIYGELVNPPPTESKTDSTIARTVAQGLVSELVTQQQQHQQQLEKSNNELYEANTENTNYAIDEPNRIQTAYDATYATIEGTTNVEVYPTSENAIPLTDYDATQYGATPEQQQEYANIDYSNYDASQYAANPNIYPGYTYDEATGQYTPDQQYLGAEVYGEHAAYDQQQYDPSNQPIANYDYTNYEQTAEAAANVAYNEIDATSAGEQLQQPQPQQSEAQHVSLNDELAENIAATSTTSTNGSKPTSILSTGDKHAANEAQKKKKRVNFVDSSETDDSSSVKLTTAPASGAANESDFDFSSSDKSGADNSSDPKNSNTSKAK